MHPLRAARLMVACLLAAGAIPAAPEPAPAVPRPEFPDPIFEREAWQNLNGTWDFDFDPENAGEAAEWFAPGKHDFSKSIAVPFPWESALSGLSAVSARGAGWYHRTFRVDTWSGGRVFLRFGAVDYEARVWVNGREAGRHEGGYTPFELDVTPLLDRRGDNHLVVRAYDTITGDTPTGKQTGWYTPTSGIWQTVWLESRPDVYLASLKLTPDIRTGTVSGEARVANAGAAAKFALAIEAGGARFASEDQVLPQGALQTVRFALKIPSPELWSPEHPRLYPLTARLRTADGADVVKSYAALREVKTALAPGRDYEYVYLNGKPIYLRGALDQSFNPKGIYTFPTDADIRRDVEIAKEVGLNFLRMHIKIDEPRLYYWADTLGLLMMQDLPSPWADTPAMRERMETMYREVLARDCNHPSIFAWVLFNETWGLKKHQTPEGQAWVEQFFRTAKALDATRLIEDNSPCNWDHVVSDINSWHFYNNDYAEAKAHIQKVVDNTKPGLTFNYIGGYKQGTAPLMNSEYGGIGAGSGDQDVSWCFKFLTNELRKHPKICGYVYTELMDIEWEHNGFVNYDRTPKEFGYGEVVPGMTLKDLNDPDFVVIDAPPCSEVPAGGTFECDLSVSHFSERDLSNARLHWEFMHVPLPGEKPRKIAGGSVTISPAQYTVTRAHHVKVSLPDPGEGILYTLSTWLENEHEKAVSRNYVNVEAEIPRAPRQIRYRSFVLRWRPLDCADYRWDTVSGNASADGDKLCGTGAGFFEYRLRLPEEIDLKTVTSMSFVAELSAKAGEEKLAWPARRNPGDYPQSDARQWPTDVTISMNGVEVRTVTLPDDPADARGVQTHFRRHQPGSYGYWVDVTPDEGMLAGILAEAAKDRVIRVRLEVKPDARNRGGLAVFGQTLGRFGTDPRLILDGREGGGIDPAKAGTPVALATAKFGSADVPTSWLVLGPFDNADHAGFTAVYPPEERIDLAAGVPTLAGPAKWKPVRARLVGAGRPSPTGDVGAAQLNFLPLFAPNENVVAYALVHAKVPAETDAVLLLGSDDGVKVWVNGDLVHAKDAYRGLNPDEDRAPVRLKAGWNRLLFKVTQGAGGWDLAARLTAPDGGAIEGLTFDPYGDLPH